MDASFASGHGHRYGAGFGGSGRAVERLDRRREPVAALAAGLDVLDRAIGGPEGPAVDDPGGRSAGRVGAGDEVGHDWLLSGRKRPLVSSRVGGEPSRGPDGEIGGRCLTLAGRLPIYN